MTDAQRQWYPVDWLDEQNPGMQDSPDAFIEREGDGWVLRLPGNELERENPFYRIAVELGDVVSFYWSEHYGDVELTVADDRTWSTDRPISRLAQQFFEPSTGAIGDSIDELIAGDEIGEQLAPGTYSVATYAWSDPIPYRFDVENGVARFIPVGGLH